MYESRTRGDRGFTLVELLVVIGIIAVLISILLPAISRAKAQANTTACAANLRSIGQAIKIYEVEFKTFPYSRYYSNNATNNSGAVNDGADDPLSQNTYVWWSLIRKIMRGGQGNWDNSVVNVDGSRATRFMAAFNCPAGVNRDAGCDFTSNPVVMPDLESERQGFGTPLVGATAARRVMKPATSKQLFNDNVILWDAGEIPPNYDRQYVISYSVDERNFIQPLSKHRLRFRGLTHPAGFEDGTLANPGPNTESEGTPDTQGNIRWRHGRNDTANFLFADGSVKAMRITTNYGTPNARGELTRGMLRPKPPTGYPN